MSNFVSAGFVGVYGLLCISSPTISFDLGIAFFGFIVLWVIE